MHMPTPLATLFAYPVDDILAALPEAADPVWDVFRARQLMYRVHDDTRSIAFKWLSELSDEPGPQPVANLLYAPAKLAEPVVAFGEHVAKHYGGTPVQLLLTELAAGQTIPRHRDQGDMLRRTHRCHLPVLTNDNVDFMIDGEPHHLKAGVAYEVDNMRPHAVANRGAMRRVHLICNVLPPGG